MMASLAIFTALKPAGGRVQDIQLKALDNWHEVFQGADFVEFEGPLIPFSQMIAQAEQDSDADIFIYANADILFDNVQVQSLWQELQRSWPDILNGEFLSTGQRVDILDDGSKRLHRASGMDYFVFRRGMFHDLPRTLMGRAYCDNALVSYCLKRGIPVIDASFALRVEHQFHDYGHIEGGRKTVWIGDEALANKRNNNLQEFGPNVLDAQYTLLPDGHIVQNIRKRPSNWQLWNLLTRGGKYWKNPKWDGVHPV